MAALLWSPIHEALDERARSGDNLFFIIAPYVKLGALELLFHSANPKTGLKLICRWLPHDLVAGVSDLEIFEYLTNRGCQLYVNSKVHLKVYAFESNVAVVTSGNLTLAGLGYADPTRANIEAGTVARLEASDWVNLYKVVNGSRLMTPDLYERFAEYVRTSPPLPSLEPAPDLLGPSKRYTIASLPATDSPEKLEHFYFDPGSAQHTAEDVRRAYHDLATFEVPAGLPKKDFYSVLEQSFRKNPFVVDFTAHLQAERSLHFGAVNTWIHQKCEDVPLPYRWELKGTTHTFYNWLAHFFSEISWDRPHHSQVVYWGGRG